MSKEHASNSRSGFTLGYRNREDVSTLNPSVLVSGSKNVLISTYRRVGSRKGYVLDGQRSTPNSGYGIYGSFDWLTHYGSERNIRAGFNSTGSNGHVQYRYVASAGDYYSGTTFTAGQVYWVDLYTSTGSTFSSCSFWDGLHEFKELQLWVDGSSNVFMWSGAISTINTTSWATGSVSVLNATPTAGGTGYVVGDVLTITTGGTGATATVTAISAGGVVTTVSLTTPGSGYTTGAAKATSGGHGTLCTLNITTVAQGYIKANVPVSVAASGFLITGTYTQAVSANGNSYTYSVAVGSYFVGLSADPTGEAANSVLHQTPVVVPNSYITGMEAAFANATIETLNRQVYITSSTSNSIYVSKIKTFLDFTFSSPRQVGEGAIITLDGVPRKLVPQSGTMFASAAKDLWYSIVFQQSADLVSENIVTQLLKTAAKQGAQSYGLVTKIKNLIAFVSFEQQINTLGITQNFLTDPQVSDISGPIVHDVQNTDFTNGQVLYFQKYLFVTAPVEGKMFIYNMTQDVTDGLVDTSSAHFWEAPQTLPFGRLSIIDGELYGHGYSESNTFKLFSGLTDDTKPYKTLALFAYDPHGDRSATKASNEFFIEGYKYQDTKLTGYLRREVNGPVVSWKWGYLPPPFIVPVVDDASIGKSSIGKTSIGGTLQETDPTDTPPKFRLIQTFDKKPYFEEQVGFGSEGVGQWWEIVSFSTNAQNTLENQSNIKDPPLAT